MIRSATQVPAKTQPEYQMKHRLSGAVIIIGLSVIVISMLLQEPKTLPNAQSGTYSNYIKQTFKLTLPAANSGDSLGNGFGDYDNDAKPALLPPETAMPVSETQKPTTLGAGDTPKNNGDKNIVLTLDKKADSASSRSKTSKKTTASPQPDQSSKNISKNGSGWVVRVGTFSSTENVRNMSALLNGNGFNVQHTKVQMTVGVATRIWLGPYTKRTTAEQVSIRLQKLTGEKGYVTKQSS